MASDEVLPADPGGVWQLIVRADELVKYAGNRDAATAYEQARGVLARAREAAEKLEDRPAGENLAGQIDIRLADLAAKEGS